MDFNKSKNKELLAGIGVGILLEGLIGFAMLYIGSVREAIDAFLVMLTISALWGIFVYLATTGRIKKNREMREHS